LGIANGAQRLDGTFACLLRWIFKSRDEWFHGSGIANSPQRPGGGRALGFVCRVESYEEQPYSSGTTNGP
jgi:hypothetical protein